MDQDSQERYDKYERTETARKARVEAKGCAFSLDGASVVEVGYSRELEDTSYEGQEGIHEAMDDIKGATFLLKRIHKTPRRILQDMTDAQGRRIAKNTPQMPNLVKRSMCNTSMRTDPPNLIFY